MDSAFFLWINGQKVGYSVNSRNAAEFDITSYVQPGKNMMAVEVYRYSAGSYLEDQDMWRLSGIFRNVTLWSSPQVHVRDFFLKTDLDAQYRDATLEAILKVKNYGGSGFLRVHGDHRAVRPPGQADVGVDGGGAGAGLGPRRRDGRYAVT